MKNTPEHTIQIDCVSWLRKNGFLTINTDVMTALAGKKGGKRFGFINHYKQLGYTKGQPDLIAIDLHSSEIPIFFIEFKAGKNNQTKDQIKFQKYMEHAGYVYVVIRSKDELKKAIIDIYYLMFGRAPKYFKN